MAGQTTPGGVPQFGPEWQPWIDPPACLACSTLLEPGYMICPRCGAYVFRTAFPMHGPWNRRIEGIAVSGFGLPLWTGAAISVTFEGSGVTIDPANRSMGATYWPWSEIKEMTVAGPGSQTSVGLNMVPIMNLNNPASAAATFGLSHLARKATTTTTIETYFVAIATSGTLVLRNTEIDRQALRWLLEPAFTTHRIELEAQQRKLLAEHRLSETDQPHHS